jgi:hypothetical protein
MALSGAARLSMVGLRFGAVLAARGAAKRPVQDLVLWDPVVHGRAYLDELRALHNARCAGWRGTPVVAAPATRSSDEIGGYIYPAALREAMEAVSLREDALWAGADGHDTVAGRLVLLCSEERAEYSALRAHLPRKAEYEVLADSGGWASASRWGDPLRPRRIPARIEEILGGNTP